MILGEQKGGAVVTENLKGGNHGKLWKDSEGGPLRFAWKMKKTWGAQGIVKVIKYY